jgi:hypothetical protein
MQRFSCTCCGNEVHFHNTVCVSCNSSLGYIADEHRMLAFAGSHKSIACFERTFHTCANRGPIHCNWLVDDGSAASFCASCSRTLKIPDLTIAGNADNWAKLEDAKRLLIYSIFKFGLPLDFINQAPGTGLGFEFLADEQTPYGATRHIVTGHDGGLITLNIAEADDAVRERTRLSMGEPYRTLVGHFRHEVGHYYWDRLVADMGRQQAFRAVFGDERMDYSEALEQHYRDGAPSDWSQNFVSTYATSHPWEDFAESWAHYFHIVDGLETASVYGVNQTLPQPGELYSPNAWSPYFERDLSVLVEAWVPLTVAMNAMNRSIGQRDFYPFVLSAAITAKLGFIHSLVHPAS